MQCTLICLTNCLINSWLCCWYIILTYIVQWFKNAQNGGADTLMMVMIVGGKSLMNCFCFFSFIPLSPADTYPSGLDVSRCPHCGKLFRGPRSSISLQEHITNIHAAVAPITNNANKFGCGGKVSSPTGASSRTFKMTMFGGPMDQDHCLVCHKCNLSFGSKEEFDKHHLIHLSTSVQVRCYYESYDHYYYYYDYYHIIIHSPLMMINTY